MKNLNEGFYWGFPYCEINLNRNRFEHGALVRMQACQTCRYYRSSGSYSCYICNTHRDGWRAKIKK